jgi:hypothetical protein
MVYTLMQTILIQASYYAIAMVLVIFFLAFLFRGFFWKYLRVKASMGRLILIKIRSALRDYYAVGKIEDNSLVFKIDKEKVNVPLTADTKMIYRCLGVNWVDYSENKGAFGCYDFSIISGYDPKMYSDLIKRALQKPAIADNLDKILIVGLIVAVLVALVSCYFGFINYQQGQLIAEKVAGIKGVIGAGNFTGG